MRAKIPTNTANNDNFKTKMNEQQKKQQNIVAAALCICFNQQNVTKHSTVRPSAPAAELK